jgi:pyruvate,water dikinase
MSGEILVARQTDPGWVSLFPAASALVVERGSPLSHSAIVAREMGLPAVVGVAGATTELTSGDRIRVDGETGVVDILERG